MSGAVKETAGREELPSLYFTNEQMETGQVRGLLQDQM